MRTGHGEFRARVLTAHISTEDTLVYRRALEVLDPSESGTH